MKRRDINGALRPRIGNAEVLPRFEAVLQDWVRQLNHPVRSLCYDISRAALNAVLLGYMMSR